MAGGGLPLICNDGALTNTKAIMLNFRMPWRAVSTVALVLVLINSGCRDEAQATGPWADSAPALDLSGPTPDAGLASEMGGTPDQGGNSALGCQAGSCPPCADGKTGCAASGPFIKGTCCAAGDNLVRVGTAKGYEPVGMAYDGKVLAVCGGTGIDISDLSDPAKPKIIGVGYPRCQNLVFGAPLSNGTRVVYAAHHGDGATHQSTLATFHVDMVAGTMKRIQQFNIPGKAMGGLAFHKGLLYVAAFAHGLITLQPDVQGKMSLRSELTAGLKNVWKVRLDATASHAYVIDAEAGLHVVSLATPAAPKLLATAATTGAPRDLAVGKDRVYVAMGGLGIDMFDVTVPAQAKRLKSVAGYGSAQSLALVGEILAVAAWNHLAIRDPKTLALLGTEHMAKSFEEDLAVAALDSETILVAEWERVHLVKYRQGLVAANLHLPQANLAINPAKASKYALLVSNLGALDLKISGMTSSEKAFSAGSTFLKGPVTIKPGSDEVLEVAYTPPAQYAAGLVRLKTNDPDMWDADREVWLDLQAPGVGGLKVGDKLNEKLFAMLDPKGGGKLDALQGKVTLLAYFALY